MLGIFMSYNSHVKMYANNDQKKGTLSGAFLL